MRKTSTNAIPAPIRKDPITVSTQTCVGVYDLSLIHARIVFNPTQYERSITVTNECLHHLNRMPSRYDFSYPKVKEKINA
jgi:hypothetical protein